MSLRTRIAAVAGLAVAVTVIAAAAGRLRRRPLRPARRGGRPRSRQRADAGRGPGGRPGAGGPGRRPAARTVADGSVDAAAGWTGPPPGAEPFGGARATSSSCRPTARSAARPGRRSPAGRPTAHGRSPQRGEGETFDDIDVDGTHLRVLTQGLPGRGAIQVARPADRGRQRAGPGPGRARRWSGAAGIATRRGPRRAGGADRARADRPLHQPHRGAERGQPDISERMDVVGRRRARAAGPQLQHDARRARAARWRRSASWWRTPATSCARRSRACARTSRRSRRPTGCPRPSARRCAPTSSSELDELTALVGDVVELARGASPGDALDDVRLDEMVATLVERARRRAATPIGVRARSWSRRSCAGEPDRIGPRGLEPARQRRKWSPPGGTVEVRLAGGELTVRDHGPGFDRGGPPPRLRALLPRQGRPRHARLRAGAGDRQQAAEAHGGSVEAANAPGGGALLRVGFGPAAGHGQRRGRGVGQPALATAGFRRHAPVAPQHQPGETPGGDEHEGAVDGGRNAEHLVDRDADRDRQGARCGCPAPSRSPWPGGR